MTIEKIKEFAKNGERHTRGLDIEWGFPRAEKPERQWFNQLFYLITKGFNDVVDAVNSSILDLDAAKDDIKAIKEKTITLESVADLSTIKNPKDGLRVYIKSYHAGLNKGGGYFTYDSKKASENDGGTVINGWLRGFEGSITPHCFGATGNRESDDTDSVKAAIKSGILLDWGDARNTYRITTFIESTLTKDIVWEAKGAQILLDSSSHKNLVVRLYLDGFDFSLKGSLTIDANLNAQSGFLLSNVTRKESNVDISDITVVNAYRRVGFTFGGDGINIRGNFGRVSLQNPTVKNIVLEKYAGVKGSAGVSGITVMGDPSDPSYYPKLITIDNQVIEDIRSEDLLYFYDQDGIRVFTNAINNESVTETIATITGGTFKNCYGRSVKSQCENTTVTKCHFVRTKGLQLTNLSNGEVNLNPEVDFQMGGGVFTDCTFLYDGHRPYGLVKSSPLRTSAGAKDDLTSLATIDNIRGTIANQPDNNGLQYILFTLSNINDANKSKSISATSVTINSDSNSASNCFIQTANSVNARIYGSISGVVGSFKTAFHKIQSSDGLVDLDYSNIRNTGALIPFYDGDKNRTDGSYINVLGFYDKESSFSLSSGKKPLVPRLSGIRPTTSYPTISGAMGIQSHFIADESEVTLDSYGTADNAGIVIMHVAYVVDSAAIFSSSSSSLSLMSSVDATRINIATNNPTQKPTSGRIRVYLKNGKTTVANYSGSSRVFTFITLG